MKTNIPFLIKVMTHPTFIDGDCTTRFIDETPELFQFAHRKDRATKLLTLSGRNDRQRQQRSSKGRPKSLRREPAPCRRVVPRGVDPPKGTRDKLQGTRRRRSSPSGSCEQKQLLITDTTFRDAHQSLLATRLRTFDLLAVADAYAHYCSELFSSGNVGRGDVRYVDAVPEGMPVAAAGADAREDSEHSVSDAAASLERRRLHELSGQRRAGVREGSGRCGDRRLPRLRLR